MSAQETVPVGTYEGDWWAMTDEEREAWLVDTFNELRSVHEERYGHNRDGYFAYEAGSSQCLALGHELDEHGEWPEDTHPPSWDGDPLCEATQYGSACTECEGECMALEPTSSIWGRPCVSSQWRLVAESSSSEGVDR